MTPPAQVCPDAAASVLNHHPITIQLQNAIRQILTEDRVIVEKLRPDDVGREVSVRADAAQARGRLCPFAPL